MTWVVSPDVAPAVAGLPMPALYDGLPAATPQPGIGLAPATATAGRTVRSSQRPAAYTYKNNQR